jgi:hypothetical protein
MCSFSEDRYFSYINDILDGKRLIDGGGLSRKKPSKKYAQLFSREVEDLKSILRRHHIRESEIEKYDRLIVDDLSFEYNTGIFVVMQLKNRAAGIGFQDNISNTLYAIGFTKTISDHVGGILTESFGESCYTERQLVEIGIEYIFGLVYNNIAADGVMHYFEPPGSGRENDMWFKIEDYGRAKSTYYICNSSLKISYGRRAGVSKEMVYKNMEKNIKKLLVELGDLGNSSENKLLYHTTTWGGSLSIMHKIRHSVGRECLDFGLLPGFYMGTRLKDTIEWGAKIANMNRNNDEMATILFLLPREYPDNIQYKKIDGEEWENIVRMSRKCQKTIEYQELSELEDIDFIYGDIACNPHGIVKNNEVPQKCKDNKKQLVSKSETADKFLQTKIAGILFHKKME